MPFFKYHKILLILSIQRYEPGAYFHSFFNLFWHQNRLKPGARFIRFPINLNVPNPTPGHK
jgi:hypothetical protein